MNKEKIFIISGEDSGDLHGAKLMESIKKINPHTEFFGVGGSRMQSEGLQLIDLSGEDPDADYNAVIECIIDDLKQ